MAKKQGTITFASTLYSATDLRKAFPEVFPELIDTGQLKVNFDVTFPVASGSYDSKAFKNDGFAVLNKLRKKCAGQFEKIFPQVRSDYEADQQGDAKAYSNAKKNLDKLNKWLEALEGSIRVDVRRAIAAKLGIESKELSTIGSDDFQKFQIRRGVFKGDDPTAVEADDYSDLATAMKQGSGKWHYCGIAAHGTLAYVIVDKKKPVKKAELKELRKNIGGSAVLLKGICYPKGTSVKFRLLSSSPREPKMVHMREGLKTQIGRAYKVLPFTLDLEKLPSLTELMKMDANGKIKSSSQDPKGSKESK